MPPKTDLIANEYGKNKYLKEVIERLDNLSSDLKQPDKFAQIFCEAAKTQKSIDYVLKEAIVDLLAKNSEAQEAVTSIVEKVDRNYQRVLSGKVGIAIWSIILLILPPVLSYLLGNK